MPVEKQFKKPSSIFQTHDMSRKERQPKGELSASLPTVKPSHAKKRRRREFHCRHRPVTYVGVDALGPL